MDSKKLIKRLIYLIFLILVVNFLANKFYWYLSIWYFDMIMHFLGGFWIGLASLYILEPKNITLKLIFKILLCVLVVGMGWEVFEIFVNGVIVHNAFNVLDTSSDIFFDLAGGGLAILYFLKRIMFDNGSEVQLK